MTRRIIPRDLAARELAVSTKVLALRVSGPGASHPRRLEEGYEPAQIRRLWSIVTYQRDLGINLAGVEVILQLVDHLSTCITASTTWPKSSAATRRDDPSVSDPMSDLKTRPTDACRRPTAAEPATQILDEQPEARRAWAKPSPPCSAPAGTLAAVGS